MNIMVQLMELIRSTGIVPVFCPKNEREFMAFREAVTASPLRVVEITMRSDFALEAVSRLKKAKPSLCVGVGTVLNGKMLEAATAAGADFLVLPGCVEDLMKKADKPFLPGCSTPSEIQCALMNGHKLLKFFPAEISGGCAALKLYAGAFSEAAFLPTGGITLSNLPDYLALGNVAACGGSFMIPKDMLARGDSEGIYRTIMDCLSARGNGR